jgi:hypothetical protein
MPGVKSRTPVVTLDVNSRESVTRIPQPPRVRSA